MSLKECRLTCLLHITRVRRNNVAIGICKISLRLVVVAVPIHGCVVPAVAVRHATVPCIDVAAAPGSTRPNILLRVCVTAAEQQH